MPCGRQCDSWVVTAEPRLTRPLEGFGVVGPGQQASQFDDMALELLAFAELLLRALQLRRLLHGFRGAAIFLGSTAHGPPSPNPERSGTPGDPLFSIDRICAERDS